MIRNQTLPSFVENDVAENNEQHTVAQSIAFHLLPGMLMVLVYVVLTQLLSQHDLPSPLIFVMTMILVLIPAELGTLYYLGWRRNGRLSLQGIVLYREPIKAKHYFWLVPIMFALTIIILIAISSISGPIYRLFEWWPASLSINFDLSAYSKDLLLVTVILWLLFIGIIGPIVEELYFRGFLLPQLSRFGKGTPLLESSLFALYHFWSPWKFLEIAIAWFPITYFGQYKRNIYVGTIVHCAINFLLSIPLLLAILAL